MADDINNKNVINKVKRLSAIKDIIEDSPVDPFTFDPKDHRKHLLISGDPFDIPSWHPGFVPGYRCIASFEDPVFCTCGFPVVFTVDARRRSLEPGEEGPRGREVLVRVYSLSRAENGSIACKVPEGVRGKFRAWRSEDGEGEDESDDGGRGELMFLGVVKERQPKWIEQTD